MITPSDDPATTPHTPGMRSFLIYEAPPLPHIRRMGLQDLDFVVREHTQCFPHGFFARLGPRFLTRYYRTFLDGPLAVAVISETDGTPAGYLVGILEPREHRRLLLHHHGVPLASSAALAMAARPWLGAIFIWTRLRRYLTSISKARHDPSLADASSRRVAVLSHLVVSTSARCQGVGASLVDEFLEQAAAAECDSACLVTLAGNQGAGAFYESRGWQYTHRRRSAEGRALDYYTFDFSR